jgi:hypothetical protein
MYSIRSLVIWVGDRRHQFEVGDGKGPNIDGDRGRIDGISIREHESGAEFTVMVTNNGITRPWAILSSNHYEFKNDIKAEL